MKINFFGTKGLEAMGSLAGSNGNKAVLDMATSSSTNEANGGSSTKPSNNGGSR